MESETKAGLIAGALIVFGLCTSVYLGARASMVNTKVRAEASIERAKEHTRRAEGRHDVINLLGWVTGWGPQRK